MCVECHRQSGEFDFVEPQPRWETAGLLRDGAVILRIEAARDEVTQEQYEQMLSMAAGA